MSLHLRFAPSADLLLEGFLRELREVWRDPFCPPTLLVPNPALGKWLTLRLADYPKDGFGCLMSLERGTLERFLWQSLQPSAEMQRLDANTLQQILCALLDESLCQRPGFESVQEYLNGENGLDVRRRAQLSAQMARLFQEYEFNRPSVWDAQQSQWRSHGMDATWLRNGLYTTSSHEPWQAELYRLADAQLKDTPYISLPRLHRLRRQSSWSVAPGHIFLFQVAKISHFHRNTLLEIAQMPGVHLHVHLTNPCAEFWEDVNTTRHKRRRWTNASPLEDMGIPPRKPTDYGQSELSAIAPPLSDPPLLELWGHTGKENIYLWCPAADWDFEYQDPSVNAIEPTSVTLLESLQSSLRTRSSDLEPQTVADDSLRIFACPDPGRAVEHLHAKVLDLVSQGVVQNLEDVVVYLPDPQAYLPHIQRVFGASQPGSSDHIPYSVLGLPIRDSLYAQGMNALLGIIEGNFDRASVFQVLRNPIVQASRKINADSVALWETWAESLGIFRAYDKEHRAEMGDQGAYIGDIHTFAMGFARLLAGNLADGSVELGYGDGTLAPIPVYRDFDTSDSSQLSGFVSQVEALHSQCTAIRSTLISQGISAAVTLMVNLCKEWLGKLPEDRTWDSLGESRVQKEFMGSLPQIALQQSLCGRVHMELAEMLEQVKACLPGELPPASKAWVGGITFAPLRQGMVLPHPVIFALGLDAGSFPGVQNRTPSDLLSHKRIVGDSDPVRDNRFAFLELIHAARKRLFLMFRSRNMQKEEDMQPASVVLELEAYLKSQGIVDIRQKLGWIPWETPEAIENQWDPQSAKLLALQNAPRYRARHSTKPMRQTDAVDVQFPFRALLDFFRNPLEYHVRHALGLRDSEIPDTLSATDEPLSTDSIVNAEIRRHVWTALLQEAFPWDAKPEISLLELGRNAAANAFDSWYWQGKSPEAQFAEMERESLQAWAERCTQYIPVLLEAFPDHRFMQDPGASLGFGKGSFLPRSGSGNVGLVAFSKKDDAADNAELWLAGVLYQLHVRESSQVTLVQLNREDTLVSLCALKPWDTHSWNAVEAWYADLQTELRSGQCADHFPLSAVQKVVRKKSQVTWDALNAESLENSLYGLHPAYRCYLEAFALADPEIPDWDDAYMQGIAKKRFAPFLERWVHADE